MTEHKVWNIEFGRRLQRSGVVESFEATIGFGMMT